MEENMVISKNGIDCLKKAVKYALIEKKMTLRNLAAELGANETYLGQCINFTRISERTDNIRQQAYDYLGIDPEKILEAVRENDD